MVVMTDTPQLVDVSTVARHQDHVPGP